MRLKRAVFAALAVSLSLTIGMVLAEAVVRRVDGYSLFAPDLVRHRDRSPRHGDSRSRLARELVRDLPVAVGVDRSWYDSDPPTPASRPPVPDEFTALQDALPTPRDPMLVVDAFKVWNEELIRRRACEPRDRLTHRLRRATGFAYVFEPPDGDVHPPYRFYPSVTTPAGLVTNRFGWRGPEIDLVKPSRTIRLAFLGASTTVNSHGFDFSYPEYVGHWLNVWAEQRGLGVRFEILNTAREGIRSTDIAAIVRSELLPLRPDLALYYEGSNQFRIQAHLELLEDWPAPPPLGTAEATADGILAHSALARRVDRAFEMLDHDAGAEPPKPVYRVAWPASVDEEFPDPDNPHLPVDLPVIVRDLEQIRGGLEGVGAELLISSFVWHVEDGMQLDPNRDRHLYNYLNQTYWPARYRDMERLAAFQNRVLARYAERHEIPFLPVAERMPLEPSLFTDGVHMTPEGLKLRAWIVTQMLIPILSDRITAGTLPRNDVRPTDLAAPRIEIRRNDLVCLSDEMASAARIRVRNPVDSGYSIVLCTPPPS